MLAAEMVLKPDLIANAQIPILIIAVLNERWRRRAAERLPTAEMILELDIVTLTQVAVLIIAINFTHTGSGGADLTP